MNNLNLSTNIHVDAVTITIAHTPALPTTATALPAHSTMPPLAEDKEAVPAKKIKVLYLHGLEETGTSPKPSSLAKCPDIDLHCPPLDCHFLQKYGPVWGLVLSTWFQATMAFGLMVSTTPPPGSNAAAMRLEQIDGSA